MANRPIQWPLSPLRWKLSSAVSLVLCLLILVIYGSKIWARRIRNCLWYKKTCLYVLELVGWHISGGGLTFVAFGSQATGIYLHSTGLMHHLGKFVKSRGRGQLAIQTNRLFIPKPKPGLFVYDMKQSQRMEFVALFFTHHMIPKLEACWFFVWDAFDLKNTPMLYVLPKHNDLFKSSRLAYATMKSMFSLIFHFLHPWLGCFIQSPKHLDCLGHLVRWSKETSENLSINGPTPEKSSQSWAPNSCHQGRILGGFNGPPLGDSFNVGCFPFPETEEVSKSSSKLSTSWRVLGLAMMTPGAKCHHPSGLPWQVSGLRSSWSYGSDSSKSNLEDLTTMTQTFKRSQNTKKHTSCFMVLKLWLLTHHAGRILFHPTRTSMRRLYLRSGEGAWRLSASWQLHPGVPGGQEQPMAVWRRTW